MDDRDFFDLLFQQFTKTTGAENTYWMHEGDNRRGYTILSTSQDDAQKVVADLILNEADADFITAVHGCFPDLVRRLHDALDEADRLDTARDEREQEIGRLTLEVQDLEGSWNLMRLEISDLRAENMELKQKIDDVNSRLLDERGYSAFLGCDVSDLRAELAEANEECARLEEVLATARSKAADVLWKIERPM